MVSKTWEVKNVASRLMRYINDILYVTVHSCLVKKISRIWIKDSEDIVYFSHIELNHGNDYSTSRTAG